MTNNQSKLPQKPPRVSSYNFVVEAKTIDKHHITYECPYCYTKYKKNGQPYKKAKHRVHTHGSCGELHNRIEARIHHSGTDDPRNGQEVGISITDNTIRR